MPFHFELTITGLVVLAVNSSSGPRPGTADGVDVISPNAHMHRSRLNYKPMEFRSTVAADLTLDNNAELIASLDLRSRALNFEVGPNPNEKFRMTWGCEDARQPANPEEEALMNWIPSLADLGFNGFRIPPAGFLPAGATSRVTLPPGDLFCRDVAKRKKDDYLLFEFPATADENCGRPATVRAMANEVVYRISGLEVVVVRDHHGDTLLSSSGPREGDTLKMCISNDMEMVAPASHHATTAIESLPHLRHIGEVARLRVDRFEPPRILPTGEHTGIDPICDGALFVYQGNY
jgi:hypothetical protein